MKSEGYCSKGSELELKKNIAKNDKEATEKAFFYMLAIPLNVLASKYWKKSAKKQLPKFIDEVIGMYEAVQNGVVSHEKLAESLKNMAGVEIEADWLKRR